MDAVTLEYLDQHRERVIAAYRLSTLAQIGKTHGVSPNAIGEYLVKQGVTIRPQRRRTNAEFLAALEEGD
jgi:hypothetical protein